jgi:hypothetical protein
MPAEKDKISKVEMAQRMNTSRAAPRGPSRDVEIKEKPWNREEMEDDAGI